MLLAYGIVAAAPWYYYILLVPFVLAFLYIPVALGAILCLFVVRHFPNSRFAVLMIAVVLVLAAGIWMAWSMFSGPTDNLLTPGWFQELLGRLEVSDQRLLPSWWLSTGLLDASTGEWRDSVMFLALMISNALFFRQASLWVAAWMYRPAYSALYGKKVSRRKHPRSFGFDWLLDRAMGFLAPEMRLIIIKDLRLFRRDPLQWSQFLIFLGLLVLYFLNIRRFTYDISSMAWVNLVSFLNLSVVGLLLSTFTTRFVYPMLSLEGRRFWILGLVGVRRETILASKFFFAVGGSLIPCSTLVMMSDLMLRVHWLVILSHQLTCVVLCLGLGGIAVGLGAWLPSLREESPSRIAAGFGGTLTLVVSTLYILIVVLLTALPTHFYLVAQYATLSGDLGPRPGVDNWIRLWLALGVLASFLIGAAATIFPLRMGLKAFRKMEF
jgi:ABC-2 type transport system permease protein